MNTRKMRQLTLLMVICAMLINGIAVFPLSAEEAILPEVINQESAAAETVPAEEPAAEDPVAEEPAAGEPTVEDPVAEKPTMEDPVAEKPEVKEVSAAASDAPAAEDSAEDVKEFTRMFVNGDAAIYMNPEADEGNIICTMRDGEAIEVCEINQDWYEVKIGGYIMKENLRKEAEKAVEEQTAEKPAVTETKTAAKVTEKKESDIEIPADEIPADEFPMTEKTIAEEKTAETPSVEELAEKKDYTWMFVKGNATIYANPEAVAENVVCEIQSGTPIRACEYDENWYKVKDGYILKDAVCTETEDPDQGKAQDESPIFSGSSLISEKDIPDDSILIGQILDEMDETRSIDVFISFEGENVSFLDTVTLYAVLRGYDNCTFTVQWQQSPNGNDWTDITGENELKYSFTVTEDNYDLFWRLAVHIVSIEIPDEMLEQAGIQE